MQSHSILQRFPKFELSYETISHKKVSAKNASVVMAIPLGKKYFIWHTYEPPSRPVCYLIGLNKDKCPISAEPIMDLPERPADKFHHGTIIYGTLYETSTSRNFIAEDIYSFCGINLAKLPFGNKIAFLKEYVEATRPYCVLPMMWFANAGEEQTHQIPDNIAQQTAYTVHHVQYREIYQISPYVNVPIPKKGCSATNPVIDSSAATKKLTTTAILKPVPRFDFRKLQFRYPAVFNIMADAQLDLYHLYTHDNSYCGLAGIQTLKTSMFMNGLFRRIRENSNLDLAEESEDEDDFQNTDCNKYVHLDRVIPIRCVFNLKHKKWVPTSVAGENSVVVRLDDLVQTDNHPHTQPQQHNRTTHPHNNVRKQPYQKHNKLHNKFGKVIPRK